MLSVTSGDEAEFLTLQGVGNVEPRPAPVTAVGGGIGALLHNRRVFHPSTTDNPVLSH